MLADKRSKALSTRFGSQWLRLQDLDKIFPDYLLYPEYGELHLGHRDQNFGARLQVGCFQQRLLLRRAIGRHHRQRVDQRLVRRAFDAVPVDLEIVGLQEIRETRSTSPRSTRSSPLRAVKSSMNGK